MCLGSKHGNSLSAFSSWGVIMDQAKIAVIRSSCSSAELNNHFIINQKTLRNIPYITEIVDLGVGLDC